LSVAVAMAGKAVEHSRLPRVFSYFLGQCQKVKEEKISLYKHHLHEKANRVIDIGSSNKFLHLSYKIF
jgi:hypothetical protein